MKHLYTISYESGLEIKHLGTMTSAKIAASRGLCFGCGDVTIFFLDAEKGELSPTYVRKFWSNLNKFGWDGWKNLADF